MRINREEKAKHRDAIEEFWDWLVAVSPLISLSDYNTVLEAYAKVDAMSPNIALEVIKDYNHSSRIDMATHFLVTRSMYTKRDNPKKIRAQFHVWINTRLGLYRKS